MAELTGKGRQRKALEREQRAPAVSCGVSFSGDIQDPPGQGPLQPTVGDPAWAGGWTR